MNVPLTEYTFNLSKLIPNLKKLNFSDISSLWMVILTMSLVHLQNDFPPIFWSPFNEKIITVFIENDWLNYSSNHLNVTLDWLQTLVCNYYPPGNYPGRPVYLSGTQGSACPNEVENGLCLWTRPIHFF